MMKPSKPVLLAARSRSSAAPPDAGDSGKGLTGELIRIATHPIDPRYPLGIQVSWEGEYFVLPGDMIEVDYSFPLAVGSIPDSDEVKVGAYNASGVASRDVVLSSFRDVSVWVPDPSGKSKRSVNESGRGRLAAFFDVRPDARMSQSFIRLKIADKTYEYTVTVTEKSDLPRAGGGGPTPLRGGAGGHPFFRSELGGKIAPPSAPTAKPKPQRQQR